MIKNKTEENKRKNKNKPVNEIIENNLNDFKSRSVGFKTYLVFTMSSTSFLMDIEKFDWSFDSTDTFDYVQQLAFQEINKTHSYKELEKALASTEVSYIPAEEGDTTIEAFPSFHYSFCLNGIISKEEALKEAERDPLFSKALQEELFDRIDLVQVSQDDSIVFTSIEKEETEDLDLIPFNQYPLNEK